MTIQNRILEFINCEGINVRQFEIAASLSNGAVSKMGDNTRRKVLDKIAAAYPQLNMNWLLTGDGTMYANLSETSDGEGTPYYDVDFECGFDELMHPGAPNPECLIRMPGYEKATMWCNATGRSMEPEISNGDIIALQKIDDISFLPFGAVYAIVTTNGLRTIKRLGRSETPGCYKLIPTNPDYDSQDIPVKMIYCVYRVMGSMKSF